MADTLSGQDVCSCLSSYSWPCHPACRHNWCYCTAQHGTAQQVEQVIQHGKADTLLGQDDCSCFSSCSGSGHSAGRHNCCYCSAQHGTVWHSAAQHNQVEQLIQHGHGRHFVGAGRLQLLLRIQLPLPFCRQAQVLSLHSTAQHSTTRYHM